MKSHGDFAAQVGVSIRVVVFEVCRTDKEEIMSTQSRLPASFAVLIVTVVATVCAVSLISARGEVKRTFTVGSGAFGVAPGQFARLSASNVFGDTNLHVDYFVFDTAGTILTIVPQEVPPGGTSFFDFGLPAGQAGLQELRTTFTFSPEGTDHFGNFAPSVEVIDTDSKKGSVYISGSDFSTLTPR